MSKGGSKGFAYYDSFAAGFGEGPATVGRIWADAKLIYKGGAPFGIYFMHWSAVQQYAAGDMVMYPADVPGTPGTMWQAKIPNIDKVPVGGGLYWEEISSYPVYDDDVQYLPGNTVRDQQGTIYAATAPSKGDHPVDNPDEWQRLDHYYVAPTIYEGNQEQMPDPLIQASVGAANTSAMRGLCYAVWENFPLANFGNRIPNIRAEMNAVGSTTLAATLQKICKRAGLSLDNVDVSLVDGDIKPNGIFRGYTLSNPSSAVDYLRHLMGAYFIDACESDGKIKFVPRSSAQVVVTIPEEDLGLVADGKKLAEFLADALDPPRSITVLYNDVALDYQQGKQQKERPSRVVRSQEQAIITLNLSLSGTEARRIAEVALYLAWLERTSFQKNLWRASYMRLDPTDLIGFVYEGITFTVRIVRNSLGQGFATELETVLAEPAVPGDEQGCGEGGGEGGGEPGGGEGGGDEGDDGSGDSGGGGGGGFSSPGPEFGTAHFAHRPTISLPGDPPVSTVATLVSAATFWHPAGLKAGDVVFAFADCIGLLIPGGGQTTPTITGISDDMGNSWIPLGPAFRRTVDYLFNGCERLTQFYYCHLTDALAPGETLAVTFGFGSGTSMISSGACPTYGLQALSQVVSQTVPIGGPYTAGPITIGANQVIAMLLSEGGLSISPSSPPNWPLAIFSAGFTGTFGNPYVDGMARYGNALGWFCLSAPGTYDAIVNSNGVGGAAHGVAGGCVLAAFDCDQPS